MAVAEIHLVMPRQSADTPAHRAAGTADSAATRAPSGTSAIEVQATASHAGAQVQHVVEVLSTLIDVADLSRREIERRLSQEGEGLDLYRFLSRQLEPRLRHVLAICPVIGLHPSELFGLAFRRPNQPSPLLVRVQRLFGPPRHASPAEKELARLEELCRRVDELTREVQALRRERRPT